MKAICIDDKPNKESNVVPPFRFGEELDIEPGRTDEYCKVLQYPETYHKGFWIVKWMRSRFAPLSDIDETELIRERKTETA